MDKLQAKACEQSYKNVLKSAHFSPVPCLVSCFVHWAVPLPAFDQWVSQRDRPMTAQPTWEERPPRRWQTYLAWQTRLDTSREGFEGKVKSTLLLRGCLATSASSPTSVVPLPDIMKHVYKRFQCAM